MEAVVATKVIWKNQFDISEWPLATTAAVLSASPAEERHLVRRRFEQRL